VRAPALRGLRGCGVLAAALAAAALGCAKGPPEPAALDPLSTACRHCRMVVSEPRLAAQIVAPGEEPVFFDDLGCLRDHLAGGAALPARAAVFVADHRTGDWVPAGRAVYTRVPGLATPMASHLIAHADEASRAADPEAAGGVPVAAAEVAGTRRSIAGAAGAPPAGRERADGRAP
jgi:copper chaperone NosL